MKKLPVTHRYPPFVGASTSPRTPSAERARHQKGRQRWMFDTDVSFLYDYAPPPDRKAMANEDGPAGGSGGGAGGGSSSSSSRKRPLAGTKVLRDGLALYRRLVRTYGDM